LVSSFGVLQLLSQITLSSNVTLKGQLLLPPL
jgi:hypothetical protein